MTRDFYSDKLGATDDVVALYLGDQDIRIYGAYEVKTAVLTQPAAFNVRLGWGNAAKDLLRMVRIGSQYELRINNTRVQTGRIEACDVPSAKVTELSIRGRDWMAPLFRTTIWDEKQFASKTIGQLVGEIINMIFRGEDRVVAYDNSSNRSILTKTVVRQAHRHPRGQLIEQIDTGAVGEGGDKIVYQNLKCKVGETWFQWLDRELRLAGLYMWADADGDFVVSAPNIGQPPQYKLTRRRGQTRDEVNVKDHAFRFDITNQHTSVLACGRYQGQAMYGVAENKWCTEALTERDTAGNPINPPKATLDEIIGEPLAIFDDQIRTPAQATWRAKRQVSEEMRAGFHLNYTIAGHTLPSMPTGGPSTCMVTQDTVAQLEDDELGFNSANELGFGNLFWLDEIAYRRSNESGTTTSFDCIHPDSLKYLSEVAQ